MEKDKAINWIKDIGYTELFANNFVDQVRFSQEESLKRLFQDIDSRYESEIKTICDVIEKYNAPRVLEIGTNWGIAAVFMQKAARSTGGTLQCVDTTENVLEGNCINNLEINASNEFIKLIIDKGIDDIEWGFYEQGADMFFEDIRKNKKSQKYDIIFVDGDHSYVQSIKDIKNSLEFLDTNGVIFLHDLKESTQGLPEHRSVLRAYKELDENNIVKFRMLKTPCKLGMIYRRGETPPAGVEDIVRKQI